MANEEHLELLKQDVKAWNKWRHENNEIEPDLSEADLNHENLKGVNLGGGIKCGANVSKANLSGANLSGAKLNKVNFLEANLSESNLSGARLQESNLRGANLRGANLGGANLFEANLSGADLRHANLISTNLFYTNFNSADLSNAHLRNSELKGADLRGADLRKADLRRANLRRTNLSGANLSEASLYEAILISSNLEQSNLSGCHIFGIGVWKLGSNEGTKQSDLVISDYGEPVITVDNIEVAQFIYLLLNNKNIRDTIDTITSKVVLILGRFTPERKMILDALREELRKHDYLPVLFDFEKPSSRNLTETVSTLAHLARFVIADITEAKSIPQELQRIVPGLPSLPVQPLISDSQYEYGMFKDLLDYPWVLAPHRYGNLEQLLSSLEEKVVIPALTKAEEIEKRREEIDQKMADEK